jgi:hypothetical protein
MNPEWIAFADEQCDTAILAEESRLRIDYSLQMQLSQGFWVAQEYIGVKAGSPADVEREITEGHSASAYHLDKDGLRQSNQNGIGQIEVGVLRLGFGPGREGADNVVARQHHQVIAFGKDHQAGRHTDPTNHVKHSICVAKERSDAGLKLRYDRPHERLRCSLDHRILPYGRY